MANRSLNPFNPERDIEPFKEFRRDLERLERSFNNFWQSPLIPWAKEGGLLPKVDVIENDKEIQIIADLPGLEEKDIHIELNNDVFTLWGEKKEEKEEKRENYYLSERSSGYFNRSFRLSSPVDENKIDATLKDGVLEVKLPKREEAESKKKRITIKRK